MRQEKNKENSCGLTVVSGYEHSEILLRCVFEENLFGYHSRTGVVRDCGLRPLAPSLARGNVSLQHYCFTLLQKNNCYSQFSAMKNNYEPFLLGSLKIANLQATSAQQFYVNAEKVFDYKFFQNVIFIRKKKSFFI